MTPLRWARVAFAVLGAICAYVIAQPDGVVSPTVKVIAGGLAAVLAAASPELFTASDPQPPSA